MVEIGGLTDCLDSKMICSIGGGKGGIGKTLITSNLGMALAQRLSGKWKRVVLIDSDLGCSDLHLCVGLKYPERTLHDYFYSNVNSLNDLLLDTRVGTLKIICGASDMRGQVELGYFQRHRLMEEIAGLDANYILLDLGAGSSFNIIDLFLLSNNGIIVSTPEPTAVQSAYGFLKLCIYRRLGSVFDDQQQVLKLINKAVNPFREDRIRSVEEFLDKVHKMDQSLTDRISSIITQFKPRLILNMIRENREQLVAEKFKSVVKKYLNIELGILGSICFDKKVMDSLRMKQPFLLTFPKSKAARCFDDLAASLISIDHSQQSIENRSELKRNKVFEKELQVDGSKV